MNRVLETMKSIIRYLIIANMIYFYGKIKEASQLRAEQGSSG